MLKIVLISTFVICTISAPTHNEDHPSILTQPTTINGDKKNESNEKTPDEIIVTKQRKYGDHIAKRDVNYNQSQLKPVNIPLLPTVLPSSIESKNLQTEHKQKRETLKKDSNLKSEVPSPIAESEKSVKTQKPKREILQDHTSPILSSDSHKELQVTPSSTHSDKHSPNEKPKRETKQPETLPANKQPNESTASLSNTHVVSQPSILPAHNHPHKREDILKKSHGNVQTSKENIDNSPKSVEISETKSLETQKKGNDNKRDIPVSLTPSTSPKPQINESNNSKEEISSKKQKSNEEKKVKDGNPLLTFTKPIPVAELFKQNSHSS